MHKNIDRNYVYAKKKPCVCHPNKPGVLTELPEQRKLIYTCQAQSAPQHVFRQKTYVAVQHMHYIRHGHTYHANQNACSWSDSNTVCKGREQNSWMPHRCDSPAYTHHFSDTITENWRSYRTGMACRCLFTFLGDDKFDFFSGEFDANV